VTLAENMNNIPDLHERYRRRRQPVPRAHPADLPQPNRPRRIRRMVFLLSATIVLVFFIGYAIIALMPITQPQPTVSAPAYQNTATSYAPTYQNTATSYVPARPTSTTMPKTISSQSECNEIFPPRLRVGGMAKVIVWQVRARISPSKYASTVNYFAEGRILRVIDGPICSDGWYWWNLYSDELGYGGWVAEADEENYYVSPY